MFFYTQAPSALGVSPRRHFEKMIPTSTHPRVCKNVPLVLQYLAICTLVISTQGNPSGGVSPEKRKEKMIHPRDPPLVCKLQLYKLPNIEKTDVDCFVRL